MTGAAEDIRTNRNRNRARPEASLNERAGYIMRDQTAETANDQPGEAEPAATVANGNGADPEPDALEWLPEATGTDPTAPFQPEVVAALAALRRRDPRAYEGLRLKLKRAGCRVSSLDDAVGAAQRAAKDARTTNEAKTVPAGKKKKEKKEPSAATVLVRLALKTYTLGVSTTGETYAKPRTGPKVIQMLRGSRTSLRNELARRYFLLKGGAASQQALADALMALEGMAQEAEPEVLYLRVARHDGRDCEDARLARVKYGPSQVGSELWLDLGDATGRAVRITAEGWTIENEAPVLFKRTILTAALPAPVMGGEIAELWKWLNVSEEDRPLVLGHQISILHPDIPHPILALGGEHGSGKSTALKVLVSLLDPSPVPLRKAPREAEAWVTAASSSWVVGLDNLSNIPDWLSDALCRAVTGDGDVRRKLYTDGDMHVFSFRRCPIFNGIDIGAVRGDLADRLLSITLQTISEDKRRPEAGFWEAWAEAHPRILGALLCEAARVEALLPSVEIEKKPRMADFAAILAAVDKTGTAGLARYLALQSEIATESLLADEFICSLSGSIGSSFVGSSAQLQAKVVKPEKASRDWPADARAITTRLMRQAPVMRKAGWGVTDDGGHNNSNVKIWTIVPPPLPPLPDEEDELDDF